MPVPRAFSSTLVCPENNREPRYPVAEGHFPDAQLQPYVHSCMVKICEGRREYSLALFFKNHIRLPVNMSLASLNGAAAFRGDIVVMPPLPPGTAGRLSICGAEIRCCPTLQ